MPEHYIVIQEQMGGAYDNVELHGPFATWHEADIYRERLANAGGGVEVGIESGGSRYSVLTGQEDTI